MSLDRFRCLVPHAETESGVDGGKVESVGCRGGKKKRRKQEKRESDASGSISSLGSSTRLLKTDEGKRTERRRTSPLDTAKPVSSVEGESEGEIEEKGDGMGEDVGSLRVRETERRREIQEMSLSIEMGRKHGNLETTDTSTHPSSVIKSA